MSELFAGFLRDIMEGAFSALDTALLWMIDGMLHVENLLGDTFSNYLTTTSIAAAYNFMYTLVAGLIVLKFLFKGFQIYILWRDGDADSSPQDMLIGAVQAMAVILLFPTLYKIMADITLQIARGLMTIFGVGQDGQLSMPIFSVQDIQRLGLIEGLFTLIFIIMAIVLCIKMIGRGFEILILRLGVPVACLGLVDSDGGLFKSYMQIFFKTMFTSIIQIVLMSLAFRVIAGVSLMHIIAGISIVTTAFATPVLMQQLLVPTGRGGGVTNKVYSGAMAANAVRGLIGK